MPPPDRDDQVDFDETQEERRLLRQVRLRSFTATPATVQPFEVSTLAWNVFVPAEVASQLAPQITLGGVVVTASGSRQVTPLIVAEQSPDGLIVVGCPVPPPAVTPPDLDLDKT